MTSRPFTLRLLKAGSLGAVFALGALAADLVVPGISSTGVAHAQKGPKGQKDCPPGLRDKGCMPPGQAKKYAIGQPLAREYGCFDDWRRYELRAPRDGYCYSRVDNDIVLIARATRNVIELVKIIAVLTH